MHRSSRLVFIFIFLLSACAPGAAARPQSAPTVPPMAIATAVAASTATAIASATSAVTPTLPPTATPPPVTPTPQPVVRTKYTLDVDFSYENRSGKVSETILYTNPSADVLKELRLIVELEGYSPAAGFNITGLWWAEDNAPVSEAAWDGIEVHFPLRQPLQPGQRVGVKIAYQFSLPSQAAVDGDRPMPIGYTARQANLVDWYPFIPPYQSGKGWLANKPSYYGEHLVFDLSDFDVNLQVKDAPKGIVVAASAEGKQDGGVLRYHSEGARSFALSIGTEYQVDTARVGNITVSSYYFPLHDKAGKQVLKTTVEAVTLYQQLFGPYPHDSLAVVEADFLDGMEYDGLYFLSRAFYNLYKGDQGNYLVAIAAHETAHQWWYGKVANDQANEPWLDEALSTYTERIFYERVHPEGLDWWWAYRINAEQPGGWVDSSVYSTQGTLQTYRDYRNAVYLEGALFFEDLRKTVGDEAFFAALKDYATRYAGKIAFKSDFFTTLSAHTTVNYQPVVQKYFSNP